MIHVLLKAQKCKTMEEVGFVYCFSNPSMPGIMKVGKTTRSPDARLSEANICDTWRPPTPYVIEFAKQVRDVAAKEKTLHALLTIERIHPRKEFFRVSAERVFSLINAMDGKLWMDRTHRLKFKPKSDDERRKRIIGDKGYVSFVNEKQKAVYDRVTQMLLNKKSWTSVVLDFTLKKEQMHANYNTNNNKTSLIQWRLRDGKFEYKLQQKQK